MELNFDLLLKQRGFFLFSNNELVKQDIYPMQAPSSKTVESDGINDRCFASSDSHSFGKSFF